MQDFRPKLEVIVELSLTKRKKQQQLQNIQLSKLLKNFLALSDTFMNNISHCRLIQPRNKSGGETGIRTPEPVTQLLPFQGSAIDHSAISPEKAFYMI